MHITSTQKQLSRDTQCHLCPNDSYEEDTDHLFVQFKYMRQIWFRMSIGQDLQHNWLTVDEILQYVRTLTLAQDSAFLIVLC